MILAWLTFAFGCGKPDQSAPHQGNTKDEAIQSAPATSDAQVAQSLRETDAALKAKEYEKATASLMRMQMSGRPMTAEESVAYSSKMRDLQSQLAEAAARGDPQAQAAIQMLRSSRSPR